MSLQHLFDETPWTNMNYTCDDMRRKLNGMLGNVAGLQNGHPSNFDKETQLQRILGKIDLVRIMCNELEEQANRLKPETQTKPKPTWTCNRSGCKTKVDDVNPNGTQIKLCWDHRVW